MIKYTLRCSCEHEFEEWFSNSGAYDEMAEAGTLRCPSCGGHSVGKAIMAPRLGTASVSAGPVDCPKFVGGGCMGGCAHAHH